MVNVNGMFMINLVRAKFKKFQDTDKHVKELIDNYGRHNKILFLKDIANNISLIFYLYSIFFSRNYIHFFQ